MNSNLEKFGFSAFFGSNPPEGMAGRVTRAFLKSAYVMTETGEQECIYAPHLDIPGKEGGACAGDWVTLSEIPGGLRIESIFRRKTYIMRRASGPVPSEQLVAANPEITLIMTSMNKDFNLSRLERYLAAVLPGGSEPIIVLTKADLSENKETLLIETRQNFQGIRVIAISAVTGENISELSDMIAGKTCALIGMSGVGKSSLVNALAGSDIMRTNLIREDDSRGRHTTTHRELIALDSGVILIDTPGMREMGLWLSGGVESLYTDIGALAQQCRFRNCRHISEPGCAVKKALEDGLIDKRRYKNFLSLNEEDTRARSLAKKKQISKAVRQMKKK